MDSTSLTIIALILLVFIGFIVGRLFEMKYGIHVKEAKRYHRMLMRMIPKLKIHYTDQYIYYELLEGKTNDE